MNRHQSLYQIRPAIWLIQDQKTTKFHVAHNDYFGTIATIINLWGQKIINQEPKDQARLKKVLTNLEKDLLWLQKNYIINKK